jgi:hypothetical protein
MIMFLFLLDKLGKEKIRSLGFGGVSFSFFDMGSVVGGTWGACCERD